MARSRHRSPDVVGPVPPTQQATAGEPPPLSGSAALPGPPGETSGSPKAQDDPALQIPHTRTSAAYAGIAVGLAVLVLVIVFIAQNLNDASVHFFTAHFRMPIGLLVLAAAVAGGLLVLLVSAARVAQLRLMARRHRAGKPTS